ncbi:Glyoxalase/Bleomycin resistance protein/Dihydroxybiphenyl dioxygenase [Amniculicola lignicola CBS 123094]|uniref:Glyoxalase/Bleomycin resistance protein/Dihydroxybiphenyl dioxygenase n=1 Tax=Amniculicola lignicola CBS 123094 TaxID=1392246 RepID=A0A6A5WM00_9PLEO|nr:Glyoxalase/Bleomycin resistance protein/Dihydroxybiphenyl dioxygenase [Amniculicola lignicola CBS 123094]
MAHPQSQLATSAWKIIPKFHCSDVTRTAKFYTEQLGFHLGSIEHDDASVAFMCSVAMGKKSDANIYIFRADATEFRTSSAMIALGTTELDKYYEQLKKEGIVKIIEDIEDKPWGYRQFEVSDPDGNLIQFFKFLEGGNPGTE